MRLWSIHPSYLDAKGLVAVWREGLLARKVLEGKTKGYTNHPQLERFKACNDPMLAIDAYLEEVLHEAQKRGYHFDATKIRTGKTVAQIPVTDGQIAYEIVHLKQKLQMRDPERLKLLPTDNIDAHRMFTITSGEVESWEKLG